MDLTHRFTVPASVEETWTAFNHLDRLAHCFPGATVDATSGDHFQGSVKVKLGPMALVYAGSGQFLERDARARRVVFEARGTDGRGNGTATARVTASMVGRGSTTEVELVTDLSLTGRPAQFGTGVIADVSDKLVDQFASCVAERFADGLGAPAADRSGAVAADDELWREWAGAGDRAAAEDSDTVTTLEMQTVTSEPGGRPHRESERPSRPGGASAAAPDWYASGSRVAQPRGQAVVNVVSALLTRYGALLGLVALVALVVATLVRRRRR
jgi:carbon monoxide dehydrogenase subunit G